MDEHQLISSVLNGNKEAFRFLYRLHKDAAWKLALYICKDQELTKDAVQVSFTSAYTYLHAFRRDASFKTWLLRIVKNESVRLCKLENRYADIDEEQVETSQDVGDTIIDKLENVDQSRWINDVFDRLNEREALVLRLFYLEELSITEVADVLQFKEGNVKVILHRARKQFKTIAGNAVN